MESGVHRTSDTDDQLSSDSSLNIAVVHSAESPVAESSISLRVERTLTPGELELLRLQNSRTISVFKQEKLEAEASKHWDVFYKRNSTKFFKDRHWTTREFIDLSGAKVTFLTIFHDLS